MKRLGGMGKGILLALGAYSLLQLIVGLSFSGTYDAGDSVQHYLFAHYAFEHPELLLSHWAKPVFTLVSAPFAAFGFAGMKVLNCLLALGTGWVAYRAAIRLGFKLHWLVPLFVVAAPEYFLAQYSGLTEPMFAFALMLGIYLVLRGNWWPAVVILSFLPFIRTEGFLLLPAFGLYLLWHGKYRLLPFLALGTVLISVLGLVQYDSIFWVFNQNPYDTGLQNYGQGTWGHFPKMYIYVLGVPLLGLFVLGWLPWGLVLRQAIPRVLTWERILLVFLPFSIYFGAHIIFWATGTGHSMGMLRVMIAIQPLAALIALAGLSGLVRLFPEEWELPRQVFVGLVAAFVAVFSLFSNPAAIHRKDLELSIDQQCLEDLKPWFVAQEFGDAAFYYDHPSVAWMLELDPFDSLQSRKLEFLAKVDPPAGSIMIWDSWFAVREGGVSGGFRDDTRFELLKCVDRKNAEKSFKFCVWRRK